MMIRSAQRVTVNTPRRGVAMLLVLISVMTATVLTTAYMASRDNSAAIGENVASAAQARWSAESGLDVGLAIMETNTDWRREHDNGRLTGMSMLGISVELWAEDLATGQPPNEHTEHVRLTSIARLDGIEQVASAELFTPATPTHAVDVSLREFAIFANETIRIDSDALVTRWSDARLSERKQRMRMAIRSNSSASVRIENSDAVDVSVYYGLSASSGVVSTSNATEPHRYRLPSRPPLPAPPDPGVEEPEESGGGLLGSLVGAVVDILDALLNSSDDVTIDEDDLDDGTIVLGEDLDISSGRTVTIQGDVRLVIYGDLTVDSASIELAPDATLAVFVGGNVEMREAYVGDAWASNRSSTTGEADSIEPDRIEFFSIDSWDNSTSWRIRRNSIVKSGIYAPAADIELRDASAVYGRIAANSVHIYDEAALFYDHRFDRRRGFTCDDRAVNKLFTSSGDLLVSDMPASLNESDLQAFADEYEVRVLPVHRHASPIIPGSGEPEEATAFPWMPTPRPRQINVQVTRTGLDSLAMESR